MITIPIEINKLKSQLMNDSNLRNWLNKCPLCNASIKDRKVSLYKELIDALYKVYCYLGQKKKHEFKMGEIKGMLSKSNYARFGDLVRFGGILYKPKNEEGKSSKADYGMNMQRAKQFFNCEREIPVQITLNQITNKIIDAKYVTVKDFPALIELLDQEGLYDYEKEL